MRSFYGISKKTSEELCYAFQAKIDYLTKLLNDAYSVSLSSVIRDEYANSIAVVLRSLLCYVSGTESLCKRCGLIDKLFFPLNSCMAAINVLPQYNLVRLHFNGHDATFISESEDLPPNNLYKHYLTFSSWLHEIIIDFKSNDCEPICRNNVIRIVADRNGAHVDSEYDPYLYKISKENVMPIQIMTENGEVNVLGNNLFTETILSIANEFLTAVKYVGKVQVKQRKSTNLFFYLQEFKKKYKYLLSPIEINPYNSNQFFPCKKYLGTSYLYEIIYNNRKFSCVLLDYNCRKKELKS